MSDDNNFLTPEQLNYRQLLLNHLDRLSRLSTQLFDKDVNYNNDGTIHRVGTRDAKYDTFHMGIKMLLSIIPETLKDKNYEKDIKKLDSDYHGKKMLSVDWFSYDCTRLKIVVDLLNRAGLLFDNVATLI